MEDISETEKITPESFESFFLPEGYGPNEHPAKSLLSMEIKSSFGSQSNFASEVFAEIGDSTEESVGWFVFDRERSRLRFFCQMEDWQPDLEQFEPLLAFDISTEEKDETIRKLVKLEKAHETWNRIIWVKMEERLAYAWRNPVKKSKNEFDGYW